MKNVFFLVFAIGLGYNNIYSQIALYGGTTSSPGNTTFNDGVIYKYIPSTNQYTALAYTNSSVGDDPNGIVRVGDFIYGVLNTGGTLNFGAIFSYQISTDSYNVVAEFDSINGRNPNGEIILANDGLLYGVCRQGGVLNRGVLFSFNPLNNALTKEVDMGSNGVIGPSAGLIIGSTGKLYGVGAGGAAPFPNGSIFEFDYTSNSFNVIGGISNSTIGNLMNSKLIEVEDSVFIGVTASGGVYSKGAIYKFDFQNNLVSNLKSFNGTDGEWPAGLIQANNQKLYGFTYIGGTDTYGTFYEFDLTTNQHTKLVDLNGTNGAQPLMNTCFQAENNVLYGTIRSGGLGNGTIIKYDINTNNFTRIYSFQSSGTGGYPIYNVVEDCITPAPGLNPTQVVCQDDVLSDIVVSGSNLKWYDAAQDGVQLNYQTNLVNGVTYYVTQTVECESKTRTPFTVSLTTVNTEVSSSETTITANEANATYQWIDCSNGNIPIAGATGQSYTATSNGSYAVIVTNSTGCSDTSECVTINSVGLEDILLPEFKIYPNPFSNELQISCESGIQSVLIIELKGKEVYRIMPNAKNIVIPFDQIPAGMYFIELIDDNGNSSVKYAIKK